MHRFPSGHGVLATEPDGQKAPDVHSCILDGEEQNEPAGHWDSVVEFEGQ
jgi:hypothetical protein